MRSAAVIVSLVLVAFVGVTQAAYNNEIEAKIFAEQVSVKLYNLYDTIAEKAYSAGDDIESIISSLETVRLTSKTLVEVVKDARAFDYKNFKSAKLRDVFKTISKSADLLILEEDYFLIFAVASISLKQLAIEKEIKSYQNDEELLAYFPDIQDTIAKSNDPAELQYYWESWREKNSLWTAANFYILIDSVKTAANLTGISVSEFWSDFYDIEEMEDVMKQIRPMYLQLHSFIRNQLFKKYGELVITEEGPIPDHLFQQVLAQAWTNGSVIDNKFPHRNLPPYEAILENNNYDATKMFRTASDFYSSLGFNPVPSEYWGDRLRLNNDEDTGDCKADIFDDTANVRMHFCHKVDFRKFLQAHGYMGRIYYALEKSHLPFYYFSSFDLEYPVGEAVILSASTPKHLKAIGLVTDFQFTDEVQMNRLLRMGIHTLLNIPTFFVHAKVMNDLLTGTVNVGGLNKHYWKLMDEFAGVEPPTDRKEKFFDVPFQFYVNLDEKTEARKFVTEILGYQFYRNLCQISGQYPGTPLHNCDFYGNTAAGNGLKTMMGLGSSKPWREVLGILLPGDAKLNGDGLLEYYQPIMTWLENQNKVENVKIGWNPSVKKVA